MAPGKPSAPPEGPPRPAARAAARGTSQAGPPADAHYALVCGDRALSGIDFGVRGTPDRPVVTWSFSARDAPAHARARLGDFDVCQLARHEGELHVLACNAGANRSADACAMIRVGDKALRWYSDTPANPHAIALVRFAGADRIVVAAANENSADDNRLLIYSASPKASTSPAAGARLLGFADLEPYAKAKYATAPKGLAWDPERALLYSVDFHAVRAWRLRDWASARPHLTLEWSEPLMCGDTGGHDLVVVPDSPFLYVASNVRAARLHVDTREWIPDPDWGDGRTTKLKGIDWHASGRRALGRKDHGFALAAPAAILRFGTRGRQIRLSSEALRVRGR